MLSLEKKQAAPNQHRNQSSFAFVHRKINEQIRKLRIQFIVGLLILVTGFSLANLFIVRNVVVPANERLEREIARKDMERVVVTLQKEIEVLDSQALDLASWDKTARFIMDPYQEYIDANLGDFTFQDSRLNLIIFYDRSGNVVWSRIVDLKTMDKLQIPEFSTKGLPANHPLLTHTKASGSIAGIIVASGRPMIVASRPVFFGHQQETRVGTLVIGRFIDRKIEERFRDQTRVNLRILLLSDLQSRPDRSEVVVALLRDALYAFRECDDHLEVYTLFPDYLGRPTIVLQAVVDRFISPRTRMIFNYVLFSNIATGILALFLILLFQKRVVHSISRVFHLATLMAKSDGRNPGNGAELRSVVELPPDQNLLADMKKNRGKGLIQGAARDKDNKLDLWEVSVWLAEEVKQRGKAEASLRKITTRLEKLVHNRTMELLEINALLQEEISERCQYEQELKNYQQRLRSLSSELLAVEERQRRQIAVDLHDRIGQSLSVSRMFLDSVMEAENIDEIKEQLLQVSEILRQTLEDTRTLTFELCPPVLHELGMGAAMEWLVEIMDERYGLKVETECDPLTEYTDSPVLTLTFRAIRELLMNVVKHARTDRAWVQVHQRDFCLQVEVRDQGAGFDPAAKEVKADEGPEGFGLFSIQERIMNIGGSMRIESAEGSGTVIRLIVPLTGMDQHDKKEE
ncbi:CHASE4 domain-containing protein [Desulfolithobacter sp.]